MLDALHLDHWWKALAVAGLAIVVASIPTAAPSFIFLGLGLLFVGIGEWINHPETKAFEDSALGTGFRTAFDWKPHPIGVVFDLTGVVSIAYSAWLYFFPPSQFM